MFLIDFTDHRVIAITIALTIALLSILIIFIRFLVRRKK